MWACWRARACVALLVCACGAAADVFSSTAQLAALLDTEAGVVDVLSQASRHAEQLLDFLERTLAEFKMHQNISMRNVTQYVSNPINAFSLIKRLTVELNTIDDMKTKAIEKISDSLLYMEEYEYPGMRDLRGAADALVRLQETYQLSADELADGRINGVQYSVPMSMDDCYQIGVILFEASDYYYASQWLTQALEKWDSETDPGLNVETIIDYMAYSNYKLGNFDDAFYWTNRIIELNPENDSARKRRRLYERIIREKKLWDEPTNAEDKPYRRKYKTLDNEERELYEALCRGEYEPSPAVTSSMKCFYKFGKHPFLRLAPFKVEEKYLEPNLYVFYDVISDAETKVLQDLAHPKLKRAGVNRNDTQEPADYRISHSAWLADDEAAVVSAISRRVEHMTELNTLTAEKLQIANYGIGGHYEPHHDMSTKKNEYIDESEGNRIATILFYLSDVEEGGGTAFMDMGLTVFPARGAAAYWRNLHASGEPDLRTTHAACPVLLGSKWVANKWLHEVGQAFNAPCDLHYQDREDYLDLPPPVHRSRDHS